MAKKKKEELTYQAAYQELEAIISEIQNDTLSLDEMAESIRKAKMLIKLCQEKLRNVEIEIHDIFDENAE
jgi:exodeoxyribonuclease VII small subunit